MGSSCHGNLGKRRRINPGGGAFGPTPLALVDDDDVVVDGALAVSSASPPFDTAERATPPPPLTALLMLLLESSSLPPRRRSVILSPFLTPSLENFAEGVVVARPKTAGEKDDDMTGDERRTDTPAITFIGYFMMDR